MKNSLPDDTYIIKTGDILSYTAVIYTICETNVCIYI